MKKVIIYTALLLTFFTTCNSQELFRQQYPDSIPVQFEQTLVYPSSISDLSTSNATAVFLASAQSAIDQSVPEVLCGIELGDAWSRNMLRNAEFEAGVAYWDAGRIILNRSNKGGQEMNLSVSNLKSGLYFVRVTNKNYTNNTFKLIIESLSSNS